MSSPLLVVTFGAKGSEVNAANPPFSNALSAGNAGDRAQTDRNPATLSYTSILTFTPAFTTYVPLTARSFSAYGDHPGQILLDPEMDVSLTCIDVIRMDSTLSENVLYSTLSGETLQVTFDLRDVPPELTFNRVGVPQNMIEYAWGVYGDVDNDSQTGCPWDHFTGAEYELIAFHTAYTPNSPVTQPIQNAVEARVFEWDADRGVLSNIGFADIEVDTESDTMTLTGYIPEITTASRLFFATTVCAHQPPDCGPAGACAGQIFVFGGDRSARTAQQRNGATSIEIAPFTTGSRPAGSAPSCGRCLLSLPLGLERAQPLHDG